MRNSIINLSLLCAVFLFTGCSQKDNYLFSKIDSSQSGLNFSNTLTESDSVNILDNEFVYNGGGIAIADLNNDGLEDLFFAGNQVENNLYLNEGNLRFTDISSKAQIKKTNKLQWSSGVTILDINLDGLKDIYVCNTFRKDSVLRKNLLYINQGLDENNTPSFKEEAQLYGIDDNTYSSHVQFFDFDLDGDLDLFIGVNRIEGIDPNQFSPLTDDGTSKSRDVLYENTFNDSLNQRKFIDISDKAGIRFHGYSHSTIINDFNNEGWPDIYLANYFLSNDLLYINN